MREGALRLGSRKFPDTSRGIVLPLLDDGAAMVSGRATFRFRFDPGERGDGNIAFSIGRPATHQYSRTKGVRAPDGLGFALCLEPGGNFRAELFANGLTVLQKPVAAAATPDTWQGCDFEWTEGGIKLSVDGAIIFDYTGPASPRRLAGERLFLTGYTGVPACDLFVDDVSVRTEPEMPLKFAGVIITEFMAANKITLEDEDFDDSDWIELYNGTDSPVDLADWSLTDAPGKPGKWRFPALTIASHEYLLVFASGKDRRSPGGPLHTSFKLDKDGGMLALIPKGQVEPVSRIEYHTQVADVSFGIPPTGGAAAYLATPTPGTRNRGPSAPLPPAPSVAFSHRGGLVTAPLDLTLLDAPQQADGLVIRYTTDGSEPREDSPRWPGALKVESTVTVRARAFRDGHLPGPSAATCLVRVTPALEAFSSNLPLVVLDSAGADIDSVADPDAARPFQGCYAWFFPPAGDGRARLSGEAELATRAGVHVRGRSSARFPKKQYALELRDERDSDLKGAPLGFAADSDFILHGPYSDKTLVRNAIAYTLAREIMGSGGAVGFRFVEVFFNQDGGDLAMDDYRGIYLFMEKPGRRKETLAVEKLNRFVSDPARLGGGWILKYDPPHDEPLIGLSVDGPELGIVYPREPSSGQLDWLRGFLAASLQPPVPDSQPMVDEGSLLNYLLLSEVFRNPDAFRASLYFHKLAVGPLRAGPVWDFNVAMGNASFAGARHPRGWHFLERKSGLPLWFGPLLRAPDFRDRFAARFRELRKSSLSDNALDTLIDRFSSDLAEAQARNFQRWPILGTFVWPNPPGYAERPDWQDEIEALRAWLHQRLSWMEGDVKRW